MRLAPLLLVLLAGCGGSKAASPPAEPAERAPTRAEYVRAANGICADNQEQVAVALSRALDRSPSADRDAAAARAIRAALPVLRTNFRRAGRLPRPRADDRRLRRFWSRADDSVQMFARAARALRDDDEDALATARRGLLSVAGDTRSFARSYGLTDCFA